jgi:hypothetical protein
MTDLSAALERCCKAAGWTYIEYNGYQHVLEKPTGTTTKATWHFDDSSHDDAIALQSALVKRYPQMWPSFVSQVRAQALSVVGWELLAVHLLTLAPSARILALEAALPRCGECGGSGEKPTERSIRLCLETGSPMETGMCPACDGVGIETC